MNTNPVNPPPNHVIVNAIHRRFDAETAASIIADMWWSPLNKCYFFRHAGMLHGVETDGYIHT